MNTVSLEKKMRVLAAVNVFIGVCFDRAYLLQRGIEALKSEELV